MILIFFDIYLNYSRINKQQKEGLVLKKASEILEEIQKDRKFIERLERRRPEDRIYYLIRQKRDVSRLTNLKRNWLLLQIDEFIDLNICPFFRFNPRINKQYCNPDCEEISDEVALKLSGQGIIYSAKVLETNCDLAEKKKCKKLSMLA